MASQSRKYADLNEYCTTVLSTRLPKTFLKVIDNFQYSFFKLIRFIKFLIFKDQIHEKVKKNGGWTTYYHWIVNEMNLIQNLINTIKNHLQVIEIRIIQTFF